jgi:predicted ATPase/DNA-binding SARP family transcriptional activator/DNA-binding CsgD family transcriptional regulator
MPGTSSETPEEVCVLLLGGFRVSVGARALDESQWRLRKAATLVKLLALAPKHRLHRECIMDLLWPDLAPKAAANNLRFALHNARRILHPASPKASPHLRLRSEHLALCPEGSLRVDIETFEQAADVARRARKPAAYEAAVRLYAGDLLPEDRYEEWAEDRREELRTTYLALLLELAELHEERAELGPAIEALRLVVKSEPAQEGAHAGLIRLYALSGQRQWALRQYQRLRETLQQNLGTEPDAANRQLCENIVAGRFPSIHPPQGDRPTEESPCDLRHNLPFTRTSFIGREQEVDEVKRALAMSRLLTLTGAAGSGKTRLALEAGRELIGSYPDGVWFVELAALSNPELVHRAVAATLGVYEQPDRSPTATLVHALRTKKSLLILDNCEHLIDRVACGVDTLLSTCPRLRIMTTSREALGIAGEARLVVPSLSLPDSRRPPTVENLAKSESVRLFLERARCHHPRLVLTPRNVGAVADICRGLEGNPLAIELAAARVGVLSVGQISTKIKDPLKLLTMGDCTAPPRQQTMRQALGWSYDLLNAAEARLFDRVSVFEGGWTLEAAEEVGVGDGIAEDDVLDLLCALVNKSLVVTEANGDGAVRFRMPDLVRRYGRERLEKCGVSDTVCRRHTEFCLEGPEAAEPGSAASAEDLRETLGVFLPFERQVHGRRSGAVSAAASAQLDEAAWEVPWAGRQAMAFEGAAEYAISQERPTTTSDGRSEPSFDGKPTPLTRREWEVAALVGRGLTNRQISAQLVLSVHTVAKHVRKILKKLGFQSRAQIAAWVGKQPLYLSNKD